MIYIGTFIFFATLSFRELFWKRRRRSIRVDKILSFLLIVLLLIFTTIRAGTTGDYITYKEVFDGIDVSDFFASSNFSFEPLYSLLQLICKSLYNSFKFFIFVIGAIVILLEHKFAKNFTVGTEPHSLNINGKNFIPDYRPLGKYYFTIFFILWGLYYANIFVIRSTIALVICLYSTKHIRNGCLFKFFMCVVIASGFHYSALCFFPAYYIYRFKSTLGLKLVIVAVASAILVIFLKDILVVVGAVIGGTVERKINAYISGGFLNGVGQELSESGYNLLIRAVANIGFLLVVGAMLWRRNKKYKVYNGVFNLYLFGCILYIATLSMSYAFARVSIFYNIYQIPLFMFLFENNRKLDKQVMWVMCVLYIFVRMIVNIISSQPFDFTSLLN